ncbi:MAG: hypothetical protein KAS94_14070 [Desulfobulbaceae bacterium]|nr:hypothetical protein [Desulfobulbaceae bacterium]
MVIWKGFLLLAMTGLLSGCMASHTLDMVNEEGGVYYLAAPLVPVAATLDVVLLPIEIGSALYCLSHMSDVVENDSGYCDLFLK